jgi:hypothetical protein
VNVVILAVEVLAIVVMVVVHRRSLRGLSEFFTERLAEQDKAETARQVALYKQRKATERKMTKVTVAAEGLLDETRHMQEDARLTHQRTDALATDVKRKVGGG